MPTFGKKWFKKEGLACTFCLQKGHTNAFCPAAPNEPASADEIPFVEKVLAASRVQTNRFVGQSREDALAWIKLRGAELNVGNPWVGSVKIYDRLRARLGYWAAIGASKSVISWLGYGVPMKFIKEPQHVAFGNHRMSAEAEAYMDSDLKKHLSSGCFIKAPAGSVKICNPILVIDQGGKLRRCDDCRHANSLQASPAFKMCTLEKDVPALVKPGDTALTRDLEKAYYKVPLGKEARGYAAFSWGGIYFLSMVMLFGMCQAPFFFTRICRPIARLCAALKIPALHYIDDWFWSLCPRDADTVVAFIEDLFSCLGWTFNAKGERGERVHLLGFIVDMVRLRFIVPEEKRVALEALLREHSLAGGLGVAVMMKPLQQTMGKVVSLSLAMPGVKTWYRSIYKHINATDGKGAVVLSMEAVQELEMLVLLFKFTDGSPIVSPVHDTEMWSDAGEVGWGAHTQDTAVSGQFEAEWIGRSSTARELRGLLLAMTELGPSLRGKVVRVNMDSMCSVRNIMKGGGKVPELCDLIKDLWELGKRLGVELVPRWQRRNVAGMQKADFLSKVHTLWVLRDSFKEFVWDRFHVEVVMPDVADSKSMAERWSRGHVKTALVLPRWEAQSWWTELCSHTSVMVQLEEMNSVVDPNVYGIPRWDFVLCVGFV